MPLGTPSCLYANVNQTISGSFSQSRFDEVVRPTGAPSDGSYDMATMLNVRLLGASGLICRVYVKSSSASAFVQGEDTLPDGGDVTFSHPLTPLPANQWTKLTVLMDHNVSPPQWALSVNDVPAATVTMSPACAATPTGYLIRLGFDCDSPSTNPLDARWDNVIFRSSK
jgi:hypothetical protein